MKRMLLIAALLTMAPVALWEVQAQSDQDSAAQSDVSLDFFYDNLTGGNWIELPDYGYCWQPDVAINNADWRPYADGYWVYTDVGWTWVSHEDFGWATYHYGRWLRLADVGWVWVPGYEWGPAWVSWRSNDDYVGWAPLPPIAEQVYEGQPITGSVDAEYDIGPACYNFVEVRYFGEPVLWGRLIRPTQNVLIIGLTVSVTNITCHNWIVYNHGPDFNRVNQHCLRPIQRLRLEREAIRNRGGNTHDAWMAKAQGDKLMVTGPIRIQKPAGTIAPPKVKERVAQVKVEPGWTGKSVPKATGDLQHPVGSVVRRPQSPPPAPTPVAVQENQDKPARIPEGWAPPTSANGPAIIGRAPGANGEQTVTRPMMLHPIATPRVVQPTGPALGATPTGNGTGPRRVTPSPRQGVTKPLPKGQQSKPQGSGKPAKNQNQNPSPQPSPR